MNELSLDYAGLMSSISLPLTARKGVSPNVVQNRSSGRPAGGGA